MPAKRELTMRQIRQMLRLHRDGVMQSADWLPISLSRFMAHDSKRALPIVGRPFRITSLCPCQTVQLRFQRRHEFLYAAASSRAR